MSFPKDAVKLSFFLGLVILLPSSLLQILGFQSMTYGIIISSIIIIIIQIFSNKLSIQYSKISFAYMLLFFFILIVHTSFIFFINDNYDLNRIILSIFIFIVILFSVAILAENLKKINDTSFDRSVSFIFIILNALFLFGITYFSSNEVIFKIIEYGDNLKKLFIFDEPSHLIAIIFPFILYKTISFNSSFLRLVFIIYFLILSILIQSLLGIIGLIAISILTFKKRVLLFILPLIFLISMLGLHKLIINSPSILVSKINDTFSYDVDFENYTPDQSNLSTLVFLWGYERAYKSTINTNGLGLGIQQMGIYGDQGKLKKLIILESGCIDNIRILAEQKGLSCYKAMTTDDIIMGIPVAGEYDGTTNFSKLVTEFGILGLILILLYLIIFLKMSLKVRFLSINNGFITCNKKDLFFTCVFIMFIFDIFLRGTGYFSSASYLFLLSIFWIYNNKISKTA